MFLFLIYNSFALDIYTQKKRAKILLFVLAAIIIGISIFYTNVLVNRFAKEEQKNVRLWAAAVHRKARLVKYTEFFFSKLQEQERERVELLAEVYQQILKDDTISDLTFYLDIISNNTTIPVILTDENGKILNTRNLDSNQDTLSFLTPAIREEFSLYEPIEVSYNAAYLTEVLKVIEGDTVELNLISSMNPGVLKEAGNDDFLYVVMPIRK